MNRRELIKYLGLTTASSIIPQKAFGITLDDIAGGILKLREEYRKIIDELKEEEEKSPLEEMIDETKEKIREKVEPKFDKELAKDVYHFDYGKRIKEEILLGNATNKIKKEQEVYIETFDSNGKINIIVSTTKNLSPEDKVYKSIDDFYNDNPSIMDYKPIFLLPGDTIFENMNQKIIQRRAKFTKKGAKIEATTMIEKLEPEKNVEKLFMASAEYIFNSLLEKLSPPIKENLDKYLAWQERKSNRELKKLYENIESGRELEDVVIFSPDVFPKPISYYANYVAVSEIARIYELTIDTIEDRKGIMIIPYVKAKIKSLEPMNEMIGQSKKIFTTEFDIKPLPGAKIKEYNFEELPKDLRKYLIEMTREMAIYSQDGFSPCPKEYIKNPAILYKDSKIRAVDLNEDGKDEFIVDQPSCFAAGFRGGRETIIKLDWNDKYNIIETKADNFGIEKVGPSKTNGYYDIYERVYTYSPDGGKKRVILKHKWDGKMYSFDN